MTKQSAAATLGSLGGKARAKNLTAKRRREIAAMGGKNSWKNRRKKRK